MTPSTSLVPGWPLCTLCCTFICGHLPQPSAGCVHVQCHHGPKSHSVGVLMLMLLLAQRMPTTPSGCARPRSRYHHRFVRLSEGNGHRGAISGVVTVEELAVPGSRGLRRWKELQSHLGEREAPAEGSSCCTVAHMHVTQPALFFQ